MALDHKCQPLLAQYQTLKDQIANAEAQITYVQHIYEQADCSDRENSVGSICVNVSRALLYWGEQKFDIKKGPMQSLEAQMTQLKCPYNP